MTRIIEVEYCGGCPFNRYSAEKSRIVCARITTPLSQRHQICYNTIPSWCPLPNKVEAK